MSPQNVIDLYESGKTAEEILATYSVLPSFYAPQQVTLDQILVRMIEKGHTNAKALVNTILKDLNKDPDDIIATQQFNDLIEGKTADMGSLAMHAELGQRAAADATLAAPVQAVLGTFPLIPSLNIDTIISEHEIAKQAEADRKAQEEAAAEEQAKEDAVRERLDALNNIVGSVDLDQRLAKVNELITTAEGW